MLQIKSIFLIIMCLAVIACGGGGGEPTGGNGTLPGKPVGVAVTAQNASITLKWNSVSGATGYNIYWSTASGVGLSGTKISGNSSPYIHSGLTNGTKYYYVITASNLSGESAASIEVSGTPAIAPADAPTLQNIIPGDQQTLLSWNPVNGATSYNLYWSTTSGSAASGTLIQDVTSPYKHTGLTNSTPYYYALTVVSNAGESSPSTEIGATPFAPPYATPQYPFDLGSAPLEVYDEAIPNNTRKFHYTLSAKAGATYMFNLNNVVDGASLEVFNDNSWDQFSTSLACSSYSYANNKHPIQCITIAPSNGLFYIRIGSNENAENVSLKVDEILNEGTMNSPVNLGSIPTNPKFATVLESGESVYRVAVTAGNYYRVILTDWRDSDAALSRLNLYVFDGDYTNINGANQLCSDYGGNSNVDHQHRLSIIHCLAKPASSAYLTIVTQETQYGKGASYNIVVEEALIEGTQSTPMNITGDALVYHGEVTADPDTVDRGYSYYKLSMTPNTDYLVDLRGMHEELDLIIADSTFTSAVCNSRELNLIDESCVVNSGSSGAIYALVESGSKVTDQFILSAVPKPASVVAPARYSDEGVAGAPLDIGPVLPITNRLSTVGVGISYYSIPVSAGSNMQISATGMNVDVDLYIYSDAAYQDRLCASTNNFTLDDSCTFIVPNNIDTIYVHINGQYTTNNGSWSAKTEEDVGAIFRISAKVL